MSDIAAARTKQLAAKSPPPPTRPRWKPCASPRSARSGSVTALLKTLGGMTPDERKVQGPAINGLKDRVTRRSTRAAKASRARRSMPGSPPKPWT